MYIQKTHYYTYVTEEKPTPLMLPTYGFVF